MADSRSVFLTAQWRHLAMLNFEIDPAVVRPLVPTGTELDDWRGRTFVSLVGFMFLDTRVLGVGIPRHRDFEEVNLRFYVRRRTSEGWRRAVVFVKELVPRAAIAMAARVFYGESYLAVPMSHRISVTGEGAAAIRQVSYRWRYERQENEIRVTVHGDASEITAGSQEEFITEHYWGYTRQRRGGTLEYQVEHPRWRAWTAVDARLEGDPGRLYGGRFTHRLKGPPASAFLADGSEVSVFKGVRLPWPSEG
jgi:uncharacterized protein YqjF (DUF2071 family)